MNTPIRTLITTAAIAAPLLLLAGCSSTATTAASNSGSGAGPSSQASQVASAEAKASADAKSGGDSDGLCALVSVSAANAAVKTTPPVTEQASGSFIDNEPECGFASADEKTVDVNVINFPADKNPLNLSSAVMSADQLTATTVLGHAAGIDDTELDISVGSQTLVLENFGSSNASQAGLIALAKLFIPKI